MIHRREVLLDNDQVRVEVVVSEPRRVALRHGAAHLATLAAWLVPASLLPDDPGFASPASLAVLAIGALHVWCGAAWVRQA